MKTGEAQTLIYLDIETFGGEPPSLDDIQPDGRLKDPAKIADDIKAKQDKAWRQQALDPFSGVVLCVACMDGDNGVVLFEDDEEGTLNMLDGYLSAFSYPKIVGHNIVDFDAFWLFVKGLKYDLKTLINAFSDKARLIDTMLMMDGPAWKKMTSLDKMAKLLGFGGKGDITGADVHDLYLNGEKEKIASYCLSDVVLLKKCHEKLNSLGLF